MPDDQLTLPIVGVTRCGYCSRPLVLTAASGWRCAHCAPQLARIENLGQWARWMRKNRRHP